MGFHARKKVILASVDKSPKGSFDAPIVDFLNFLNEQDNVVTTSSCSGRLSLFCPGTESKGGEWLYVTHEPTASDSEKVWEKLQHSSGECSLLFEPFLLHCEAATLEDGQKLLQIAQQAGFRESGLSVSARVIFMVRTTAFCMQVPLEKRLVTRGFVDFLVNEAHRLFELNIARTRTFEDALRAHYSSITLESRWAWIVPTAETKRWKTEAERRNLFDKERKVQSTVDGMMIPILSAESPEDSDPPVVEADLDRRGSKNGTTNQRSKTLTLPAESRKGGDRPLVDLDRRAGKNDEKEQKCKRSRNDVNGVVTLTTSALTQNPSENASGALLPAASLSPPRGVHPHSNGHDDGRRGVDGKSVLPRTPVPEHADVLRPCVGAQPQNGQGREDGQLSGVKAASLQQQSLSPSTPCAVTEGHALSSISQNSVFEEVQSMDLSNHGDRDTEGLQVTGKEDAGNSLGLAWIVPRSETKQWKNEAEKRKWIDKSAKLQAFNNNMAIPLLPNSCPPEAGDPPLAEIELKRQAPKKTLADAIEHLNGDFSTIPSKWEMKGSVALFPSGSFRGWPDTVWSMARNFLGCRAVGVQHAVKDDGFRSSRAEIKFPPDADPWVIHEDNGVRYVFDITKVMFSRGNIKEKLRVADFYAKKDIVLDLYAGIGYWAFPLLLHAQAAHVVCCEWNPNSIEGLKIGAKLNRVSEKISIVPGDNAGEQTDAALSKFSFDRAVLGLLPSSERSWPVAAKHLRKDKVTYAHVHENVHDLEEESFVQGVVDKWKTLTARHVELIHVERVKWYAPHVRHCVLDLRISAV